MSTNADNGVRPHAGESMAELRSIICRFARQGATVFVETRTHTGPGCATGKIGSLEAQTLLISINSTARVLVPLASIVSIHRVGKKERDDR